MLQLQQLIHDGIEKVEIGHGTLVSAELVRTKNKFAKRDEDPTHFRNILNNIQVKIFLSSEFSFTTFAEIQIYHKAILTLNNNLDAHTYYEYFRQLLRDSYATDLDTFLVRNFP